MSAGDRLLDIVGLHAGYDGVAVVRDLDLTVDASASTALFAASTSRTRTARRLF